MVKSTVDAAAEVALTRSKATSSCNKTKYKQKKQARGTVDIILYTVQPTPYTLQPTPYIDALYTLHTHLQWHWMLRFSSSANAGADADQQISTERIPFDPRQNKNEYYTKYIILYQNKIKKMKAKVESRHITRNCIFL